MKIIILSIIKMMFNRFLLLLTLLIFVSPEIRTGNILPSRIQFGLKSFFQEKGVDQNLFLGKTSLASYHINFENIFSTIPIAASALIRFQAQPSERNISIIAKTGLIEKSWLQILVARQGSIMMIQISYFAAEKQFLSEVGLFLWSQHDLDGSNLRLRPQSNFFKFQKTDTIIDASHRQRLVGTTQISLPQFSSSTHFKILQIQPFLNQFSFTKKQTLEVAQTLVVKIEEGKIGLIFITEDSNNQNVFPMHTLLLKLETSLNLTTIKFNIDINELRFEDSEQILPLSNGKVAFFGLNSLYISSYCTNMGIYNITKQQNWKNQDLFFLTSEDQSQICHKHFSFLILTFWQKDSTQQIRMRFLAGAAPSNCPAMQCLSTNNYNGWIWNNLKKSTTTVVSCLSCPPGCATCSNCTSEKCCFGVNANCSSCISPFTLKKNPYCDNLFYCACPDNTFPNATANTCQACGIVIPGCTTCMAYPFFAAMCWSCGNGFFGGGDSGAPCATCPTGCSTCSSASTCSKCGSNLILVSNVCQCNTNQSLYYSTTTKSCVGCSSAMANCKTCTGSITSTTCSACSSGFYVSGGGCTACTALCSSCNSTICLKCPATFNISGSNCICNAALQLFLNTTSSTCVTCASTISSCQTCSGTSTTNITCSVCTSGTFKNGSSCVSCPSFCNTCNSLSNCSSCHATFVIINGSCTCNTTDGYYYNLNTSSCILCSSLIADCAVCQINSSLVSCQTASPGYYVDPASNLTCNICPTTCTTCTDALTCSGCVSGYSLNGTTTCSCINCPSCIILTGLAACADCNTSTNTCTLCIPGTFLNISDNTCPTCPVGCATCLSLTSCQSCQPPFVATIPAGGCQCNSFIGQYYDSNTSSCTTCSTIQANCTSCSSVNYTTSCLTCTTGNYLNNGTCIVCTYPCTACTATAICQACSTTFTLINSTCQCDSSVSLFYNSSSLLCQLCSSMINNCLSCVNISGSLQCSSCPLGYYIDNTTFICDVCPNNCISCLNSSFCQGCLNTYVMINNLCVCDMANQYFQTNGMCTPCYNFVNYCTSCAIILGSVKCSSCPNMTYLSPDQLSCLQCPDNCDICTSVGCSTCSLGFNYIGGICQCMTTCFNYTTADSNCIDCFLKNSVDNVTGAVSQSLQCLACSTTTYLAGNQFCLTCPSTCSFCTSSLTCQLCLPSLTLINGECICNPYQSQVLYNGACYKCPQRLSGCDTCSFNGTFSCSICFPSWVLNSNNTLCLRCSTGCLTCLIDTITCSSCISGYTLNGTNNSCIATILCGIGSYVDQNTSICFSCSSQCLECFDTITCWVCNSTYTLIQGYCSCDIGLGYFSSLDNSICNFCSSFNSSSYSGVYLGNCEICQYSSANFPLTGIECLSCNNGFYLSLGVCNACDVGCNECTSPTSCCSCQIPFYTMIAGICFCNANLNYFANVNSTCSLCVLINCSICASLTDCAICAAGYFLNEMTKQCQPAICGNGVIEGVQQCDTGNVLGTSGCNSLCIIENYFLCNGQPSVCVYDTRFNMKVSDIVASCNQITYSFQIYPYNESYAPCNFSSLLESAPQAQSKLINWSINSDTISYTYSYNATIEGSSITFTFNPQTLCTVESISFPPINITFSIVPYNNIEAIYYAGDICVSQQKMTKVTQTLQYASYGVLALSALPCKIVGLQLFGVLQLAFFSLGSMDNVNVLMAPLLAMKGVNGLNTLNIGSGSSGRQLQSSSGSLTPDRIQAIGYSSNFLRNCNLMFFLVVGVIIVSFILFLLTYLCKNCAPTLHKVAKRLIKQVLLTLILFNCFNFAYSAGVHFNYASHQDNLYLWGTLSAVATLIIPILMAIGLVASEEEGFGEYKDKLKDGCVEKSYFVVTIIYRMSIGIYMSSENENELSTLIVLALSILFLMYNLVNLPFRQAYHNYRANICHLTQFIILFVVMYYRSMKSTSQSTDVAYIFSPVYVEFVCIFVSLIVSLIVLIYEIYIFIRDCCQPKKEDNNKVHSIQGASQIEVSHQVVRRMSEQNIDENKIQNVNVFYDDYENYN